MGTIIAVLVLVGFFFLVLLPSIFKVLPEYERGVVFFFGRYQEVKGPGLIIIIPGIQRLVRISLRTVTMDVPPQEVISRDNVSVRVNAVVYFRVIQPDRAVISVENYLYATNQLAQTTLRSVCGQVELDDLLSSREQLNKQIQEILDRQTDPWGVKVGLVEIKAIDLPEEMKRAMAKQAEAEREKRAKIIHAEGEFTASQKILEASDVLSRNPMSLQLRYLQTLTEIASDKSSTILFPIPMDLVRPFLEAYNKKTT